jgi:large subunit ribosomal protein L18
VPAGLPKRCIVEAKAVTKRESREARHARIRRTVSPPLLRVPQTALVAPSVFPSTSPQPPLPRPQVEGTTDRPRLAVFRSNNHIYAQVINDSDGHTLATASTLTPEVREKLGGAHAGNVEGAKLVGSLIADMCKQKNIEKVCFDRGGFRYHGRVQALADAAREAGLSF